MVLQAIELLVGFGVGWPRVLLSVGGSGSLAALMAVLCAGGNRASVWTGFGVVFCPRVGRELLAALMATQGTAGDRASGELWGGGMCCL